MKIIEIDALDNGAHRNQTVSRKPDLLSGWAVIPEDMTIPDTFPFVNIEVDGNTVISMSEGVVPSGNKITKETAIEKDLEDLGIDFQVSRTVTGTYTGTGWGSEVTLNVGFAPKIIFIHCGNTVASVSHYGYFAALFLEPALAVTMGRAKDDEVYITKDNKITVDGNNISFGLNGFNLPASTNYFVAIG